LRSEENLFLLPARFRERGKEMKGVWGALIAHFFRTRRTEYVSSLSKSAFSKLHILGRKGVDKNE